MSKLLTLEEYAQKHNIAPNYLHLLAAVNKLPHSFLLGRVYANEKQMEGWEKGDRNE